MATSKEKAVMRAEVLILRGLLFEMPDEDRNKILNMVAEFKLLAKKHGEQGLAAMTMALMELSLEMD